MGRAIIVVTFTCWHYTEQVQLRVLATQQRHLPPLFRGQLMINLWLFPLACPGSINSFNCRPAAIPTAAVVLFFAAVVLLRQEGKKVKR
jgi:hypothetical protein